MNILFVCTGNTCRSPMAEAILKSYHIEGLQVKSAGVFASSGQAASKHVITILNNNNISHQHSSSPLQKDDIHWATYIFTMTEGHKQLITASYPDAIEKTFTLKEYVDHGANNRDISDPFGGDEAIYEQTYQEISALIKKLVESLKDEK